MLCEDFKNMWLNQLPSSVSVDHSFNQTLLMSAFESDDRLTLYRLSNAVPACCTPIHDSQKPTDTENRAIGIRTQCWKETLELEERKLEFDAMIDRTACFFYHYSVQSVARKNFDSSFSKFDHLVTAHYICFSIQPILLASHQNTGRLTLSGVSRTAQR